MKFEIWVSGTTIACLVLVWLIWDDSERMSWKMARKKFWPSKIQIFFLLFCKSIFLLFSKRKQTKRNTSSCLKISIFFFSIQISNWKERRSLSRKTLPLIFEMKDWDGMFPMFIQFEKRKRKKKEGEPLQGTNQSKNSNPFLFESLLQRAAADLKTNGFAFGMVDRVGSIQLRFVSSDFLLFFFFFFDFDFQIFFRNFSFSISKSIEFKTNHHQNKQQYTSLFHSQKMFWFQNWDRFVFSFFFRLHFFFQNSKSRSSFPNDSCPSRLSKRSKSTQRLENEPWKEGRSSLSFSWKGTDRQIGKSTTEWGKWASAYLAQWSDESPL